MILQLVAAETNLISNLLVLLTFSIGDHNYDFFLSNITLENIDNQITITFNRAILSKQMIPTNKSPSNIIVTESCKDKKMTN